MEDSYVPQTVKDLKEDFEELEYLASDGIQKLEVFIKALEKHKRDMVAETWEQTLELATSLKKRYRGILARTKVRYYKRESEINFAITEKKTIKDQLRNLQGILGATLTATDWQSPSFTTSGVSQAGIQTGRIYPTINDYKRDQHWDAHYYEEKFKKEYIDAPFKLPIQANLTQSGQAAFTTALAFLTMEQNITGPIVMGSAVYFQNKDLLIKQFGKKAIEADEMNLEAVEKIIQTHHPRAFFFDTLGNVEGVLLPDIHRIVDLIIKHATDHTFVILDATCLPLTTLPLTNALTKNKKVHLIVIESLNKYYQFGLDRTTGGIVWGLGKNIGKLFDYRENLGTHILDASVHMLPTPNRTMLTKRFARLERNANLLATRLREINFASTEKGKIESVVYPGRGSFLTIRFAPSFRRVSHYKKFMKNIMAQAKKSHVELVAGSSFGLDTTRVYLTAIRAGSTTPFIRISVGTETLLEMEKVVQLFLHVFLS